MNERLPKTLRIVVVLISTLMEAQSHSLVSGVPAELILGVAKEIATPGQTVYKCRRRRFVRLLAWLTKVSPAGLGILLGGVLALRTRGMAGQDNKNAVKFSFIGDHPLVRRIGMGAYGEVWLVRQQQIDPENHGVLHGWPCPDPASFHRLRSGGLMRGDSLIEARPRCGIYGSYLKRHLR